MNVPRKKELRALQARIHHLERPKERSVGILGLGIEALDEALPDGGLAKAAVHEVTGSSAGGFAAMLAGKFCKAGKPVLWCVGVASKAALYGPGLAAFGVSPDRLIVVHCRAVDEMLWAMEEGLREEVVGLVIGEPVKPVSMIASRRLQLAAETGGTMGLILCRDKTEGVLAPSAVTTRWQVDGIPSLGRSALYGKPRAETGWRLELRRCRGAGKEYNWDVEWDDAACTLALAADAGHRGLGTAEQRFLTSLAD